MIRTWTYFQIRGKVSKTIPLPFTDEEVSSVTKETYIEKLSEAMAESKGMAGLKEQKLEALRQAYAGVSLEVLERLKLVVEADCKLFGYETEPNFIFVRDVDVEFDYFKAVDV